MPITGSIDGYGTFTISDVDWADAKARPVFLGEAAPAANRILHAVLSAGPDAAYTPKRGDQVQVRAPGGVWGRAETVDVVGASYLVTLVDGQPQLRPLAEVEVRRYIPGTEPSEPEYPAWVQPSGAHDAYSAGDRVAHGGKVWESTVDGNVWEPGVSGWMEVV